ncbi:MAG: hypothetical protein WBM81_13700, partial [Sedimenticolaceae bacterium]
MDLAPREIDTDAVAPAIPVTSGEVTPALLSSSTMVNLQSSFRMYGVAFPSALAKREASSEQPANATMTAVISGIAIWATTERFKYKFERIAFSHESG